jgi:predicted dehydrogenase
VAKWYADAGQLINDPAVDAVYIATPVGSHCEYALQVCAAGKPALVEKPMARNATECARMVEAFAGAGVPLFVAYYRRGLPRFVRAREWIQSGRLGTVTGVNYRYAEPLRQMDSAQLPWRWQVAESGGGLFMDLGCHTLDILDFLVGPLGRVSGQAVNVAAPYEVEDQVVMAFVTETGAAGTAAWNFAAGMNEDLIEITGTAGTLRMSTYGTEPVRLETAAGVETADLPNPPHVHQPLIQTIVDELSGTGRCPSSGQTALRTARVMDAVLTAYYGDRAGMFWERPATWPGRRR